MTKKQNVFINSSKNCTKKICTTHILNMLLLQLNKIKLVTLQIVMESKRVEKINRLIQKDLAEILREKAQSEFFGAMMSVTKVAITSDLSFARVYISIFVLGNKYTDEQILKLIMEKKDYIRMLLGQKVRHQLRVVPDLMFFIDDTLEYAKRIDELLKS